MRMLFMPKPMLLSDLDVWVKPDSKRYVRPCLPFSRLASSDS